MYIQYTGRSFSPWGWAPHTYFQLHLTQNLWMLVSEFFPDLLSTFHKLLFNSLLGNWKLGSMNHKTCSANEVQLVSSLIEINDNTNSISWNVLSGIETYQNMNMKGFYLNNRLFCFCFVTREVSRWSTKVTKKPWKVRISYVSFGPK